MYKAQTWSHHLYEEKMLPDTNELIKKIKKLLDPNMIMNPGHGWGS